jgi:hypothetical protein
MHCEGQGVGQQRYSQPGICYSPGVAGVLPVNMPAACQQVGCGCVAAAGLGLRGALNSTPCMVEVSSGKNGIKLLQDVAGGAQVASAKVHPRFQLLIVCPRVGSGAAASAHLPLAMPVGASSPTWQPVCCQVVGDAGPLKCCVITTRQQQLLNMEAHTHPLATEALRGQNAVAGQPPGWGGWKQLEPLRVPVCYRVEGQE